MRRELNAIEFKGVRTRDARLDASARDVCHRKIDGASHGSETIYTALAADAFLSRITPLHRQKLATMKFILVSGGVVSGIGKGVIGTLDYFCHCMHEFAHTGRHL